MALGRLGKKHATDTTQILHNKSAQIPDGAVLLGVLKSVESELRRRELLGIVRQPTASLWFLAETERNVFLWRNGKSLDDQRDYSFWIDVKALIAKRREQLKNPVGLNPFVNPLWGTAPLDHELIQHEFDYLDSLDDLITTVFRHAEALSHASEAIRKELEEEIGTERLVVVLPSASGK